MLTREQKIKFRRAILVEGTRVLDLVDDRETHIVSYHAGKPGTRFENTDMVKIWFDSDLHKATGTGTHRRLDQIVLLWEPVIKAPAHA